jgi:putative spermidine/putrescine transport system substrate-binding protein
MRYGLSKSVTVGISLVFGSVALLSAGSAHSQAKQGELAFVGFGGTYQKAQREAYFEAFSKATGIRVREDTGPQLERLRAEVMSGRPAIDLTATNQTTFLLGLQQNLWAPIDYKYFDKSDLDAMANDVKKEFGVGTIYYSDGLAFNTNAFPDGKPQPQSWVDFFDTKKFPGKRGLPKCTFAAQSVPEGANIAMGASKDDIYKIDVKKAAAKLREIKDDVIWWDNPAQPGQMLASGEVVMALGPTGRQQTLADGGAPVRVIWEGARNTFDLWFVPKGASNADNAMRLIAYASKPGPQAEMARLANYAPTNPKAFDLIDKETAKKLVTYPDNFKKTFAKNEEWWSANRDAWIEICSAALVP